MVDALALNRGATVNAAIGAGGNHDDVIECTQGVILTTQVDMTGSALGDAVVTVTPYEADGVTLSGVALPSSPVVTNVFAGGHAYAYGRYDVSGIDRVRFRLNNANVGGQTITRKSWRVELLA